MVRRDDDGSLAGDLGGNPASGCEDPAGASPVSVGGNAPSSRLPAGEEIRVSEAERREPGNRQAPLTGRQARGPQHEVKTAASTQLRSEGRAAHFTAKATPMTRESKRDGGLGGVRVAAHVQGSTRNTREPSAQPEVWRMKRMRIHRKGRHLKPGEAQRWKASYFSALGLVHLHGTVKDPEAA